jgi:hypothetical protein
MLATLIAGALVVGAFTLALISATSDPVRLDREPEETGSGYSVSREALSIGDTIRRSEVIFVGIVKAYEPSYWNSPDRTDWYEAWEKEPSSYATVPLEVHPVVVAIEEVISDETRKAPGVGESIVLTLEAATLPEGDRRIFFVRQTMLTFSDGSTESVWFVNPDQESWIQVGGHYQPVSQIQSYSLTAGEEKGDVSGFAEENGLGRVTLAGLKEIISAEERTNQVDFASFEAWPWREVYAEVAEELDAPAEPSDDQGEEP